MTRKQHILQVSELTRKVRFLLESEISVVWLTGEISNFVAASSGHWYLSLKDNKSQVKCAIFKGNNRYVRIKPANGQQVLVKARVSLYEPRGDFQLIIEQMEDAGEGLLRQQYEALKARLSTEGLFLQENKQPLASHYNKVGIVTSPTGAAVKDIISVLARRSPTTEVIIYPALVQGELAAQDIIASIETANQRDEVDILIVGRGGGSLEDLWCFNDENLVRAIFYSRLPIISAVGHEIDTTLSDYVADVRAPTPSAAAELLSSDMEEQQEKFSHFRQRLLTVIARKSELQSTSVEHLSKRLQQCEPQRQLNNYSQQIDELSQRLNSAINNIISYKTNTPKHLTQLLNHLNPNKQISQYNELLATLTRRLNHASNNQLNKSQQQFAHLVEQLHLVSPLATIARGYSIVRDNEKNIVRSVDDVKIGQQIHIQINDGNLSANVTGKNAS